MSANKQFANKQPNVDNNVSGEDTEDEITIKRSADKEEVTEELIKKKKARITKPFTDDMLTAADGLQRIYQEFPKACPFHGRGAEAKDIKKLTTLYKEWAHQLHPGIAFPDFLVKCESLGTKGKVKICLDQLRETERERFVTEVLGVVRQTKPSNASALTDHNQPQSAKVVESVNQSTSPSVHSLRSINDEVSSSQTVVGSEEVSTNVAINTSQHHRVTEEEEEMF